MPGLVLGIAAAIAASTLYSLGIAFQAADAKAAPDDQHLRVALLWGLVQRARWLRGTAMSILGWPLQVVALGWAPLVVVQPTLAFGLLVLVFAAQRMLGEHAGRRDRVTMAVIIASVVGIALTAPPNGTAHGHRLELTLVLVGLGALTMTPYLLSAFGRRSASITMIGAGLGFAWSGVATKLVSDDLHRGHLLVAALWGLSTAAASVVGALSEMSALQERPAILVAPVVFVTQTAIPVILAPLLLGESFSRTPAHGIPLALCLAALVVAAASLARSPLLLALMAPESEPEAVSDESGSGASPSAPSPDAMRSMPDTDAAEPSAVITRMSPRRMPP
jgi:FtsH-binding integral membrane protein